MLWSLGLEESDGTWRLSNSNTDLNVTASTTKWGFPRGASGRVCLPVQETREAWVGSLNREDLSPWGHKELDITEATLAHTHTTKYLEENARRFQSLGSSNDRSK